MQALLNANLGKYTASTSGEGFCLRDGYGCAKQAAIPVSIVVYLSGIPDKAVWHEKVTSVIEL
ncbi:MAG: hypothetical protein FD166_1700 [Bacteroidetes bacterium]|nr:MAG: hypothetical protein FD166_1700 [Bacteroidota bacterium]